jgi:hypothetical protein
MAPSSARPWSAQFAASLIANGSGLPALSIRR